MSMSMHHNHTMNSTMSMNSTMNSTHGMGHNHSDNNHGNMGHGNNGEHTMGMHGMQMYFVFSSKATILFKEWDIDSTSEMVWSCVIVFLMAAVYEGFKVFRELIRENYVESRRAGSVSQNVAAGKDISFVENNSKFCNWHHFLQSFLHIIQVALSYFLMLIAMTFNGWLFISVCVGAGVGYFLFSWKVSKAFDINEHCH